MAHASDVVPEVALDHQEILRRGGANCGDEDFDLCKCPHCGRIYLIEYEADTLYLDPADLARRVGLDVARRPFHCETCAGVFPREGAWIGAAAPAAMRVAWSDLAASPWRWVAVRTR